VSKHVRFLILSVHRMLQVACLLGKYVEYTDDAENIPLKDIVNLIRKMKSIAEVWRRKTLMGHGKWGDISGYATRFAPVTSFHC